MIRVRLTRLAVVALLAAGAAASVGPDNAHAAGLTCGRAYVEPGGKDPQGVWRVIHNCTGSGTVQYTVDCLLSQDFIFTHVYREPGFSIRKAVTCGSGSYGSVSWKIV